MLILKDKTLVPPGGYRYIQRESGVTITARSLPDLIHAVREHRIANGYPIQMDMEVEVEHGLCQQVPESCVDAKTRILPRLTVQGVTSFTLSMAESILRGSPRESQEVAEKRAETCVNCEGIVKAEGCAGCNLGVVHALVKRVSGGGETQYDANLESCRYCGCLNSAQIWFPLDILQRHMPEEIRKKLPNHCWKK